MNVVFFSTLVLYFIAMLLQFSGASLQKEKLCLTARIVMAAGLACHTAYSIWRGVEAGRLPLANQFEFASGFSWAAAVLGFILYVRLRQNWPMTASIPAAFLVLSYAAFLPREIKDIMPALRSTWFALHIGSAIFAYAAFAISGTLGVAYLLRLGKVKDEGETKLRQNDFIAYRMVCLGFLLLTVVIFSGAIWAEQAWSSWWSWDPKETWALITWIFYAIYLHQRLRMKWRGKRMAWMSIIAVILVIFTFAGVNLLLPGLHSYAGL